MFFGKLNKLVVFVLRIFRVHFDLFAPEDLLIYLILEKASTGKLNLYKDAFK